MDVVRSTFTINRGTESIVYLSPYNITTDTSILPFSESTLDKGYKLDRILS